MQHVRKIGLAFLFAAVAIVAIGTSCQLQKAKANTVNNDTAFQPTITSATGAASASNATIAAVAGKIAYIEGFDLTGCAATTGNTITITVTGLQAGTQSFCVSIAGTVTNPAFGATNVYSVRFPQAMPASAANTAITVNVGSFGSGSTAQAATAYGYYKNAP
jgi:hypothetical protein